jgi:hypothetical protein
MSAGELAFGVLFGGIGFAAADALDRFLATYDPSAAERPKDKFTSDGTGTLANTLNIATRPGLVRLGAGTVITAAPAIGSMYIRHAGLRSSLQGMSIGAGVSLFKSIWNNFLMPMIIGKDTSPTTLQKSYIARLYPAEVAASINMKAIDAAKKAGQTPAMNVSSGSSGLSGADVGPHALAGDSPYPDAVQSLRRRAGVSDEMYPDAAEALRRRAGVGGPSSYPDAAEALRKRAGVGYEPAGPPEGGTGPQAEPHKDPACGCVGTPGARYAMFLGDEPSESDNAG